MVARKQLPHHHANVDNTGSSRQAWLAISLEKSVKVKP